MPDLAPEIKVKITGEDTGVSAAIRELSVQLNQLKRTQDDTAGSAQRMGSAEAGAGRSMREAREGARLLSEETGVHLNRALTGVLARSSTLGPIINAAFPIAAAFGFGEVIAAGTEKLTALIANTFIYTEAMQREYAAQIAANKEFEKSAEKIKELQKAYELIGLKGSDLGAAKLAQLRKEIDDAGAALKRIQATPAAVVQPSWIKSVLGTIGRSPAQPETQPGIDAKAREMGLAQEKQRVLNQETLNQEKQLGVEKADEAKAQAAKAKSLKDQINKATLAQIEAGFANELTLYKAQHAKEDQEAEASYVKGLESLAAYYDRKKQLAIEESKKEIDALAAERQRVLGAPTKDKTEEIANQTKAATLANAIAIAKVNATKTQQQLDNEQAKKQDELDKKVLEFQSQIAKAQGLRFDEAAERITAEAKLMEDTLREAGLTPAAVDAMVAKFRTAATQQAQFASSKTTGQNAIAGLSDEEEDIRLKNSAIVADVKIAELERQRIPVLQQLAAQLKAAAVGPEQVREADDYAKAVDRIALAAQKSTVSMKNFADQASTAIKGDLATWLGSTITQARNVEDAFRQLGASVVSSIQRIVANLLIELATRKLVEAITKKHDQGGGQAAAQGEAGVKMIAAGAVMAVGGVVVKQGADALEKSSGALLAAATMLLIANAAGGGGGGVGHAAGGFITGPGTGTSDSIPARLSHGEFVVSAAAVQDYGVDVFTRMNRGLRIPSIAGLSIPRFAEGGLVQAPGGGVGGDLRLGIGLDEGLVIRHLSSKTAGKVILQHLANNPKAAGKALQRGE